MNVIWRELYRTADLGVARTVATTVASMEFDVQILANNGREVDSDDPGPPPYSVQVDEDHHRDLLGVVDEILAEQDEFDEFIARRKGRSVFMYTILILLAVLTFLLALMQIAL